MFNTKKLHNVEQFRLYDPKHTRVIFRANGDDGVIGAEIELNTVGPCVARLHLPDEGKKPGEVFLLGTFEGNETVQFGIKAAQVLLSLEPSGEVWFRKSDTFAVADNPNPHETFTRLENMGLEMDELGIALHRQGILNRIEQGRQQIAADQYSRKLERLLEATNARVDALTAQRAAEAEAQPETVLAE